MFENYLYCFNITSSGYVGNILVNLVEDLKIVLKGELVDWLWKIKWWNMGRDKENPYVYAWWGTSSN
jgi:hypothetical protein